MAMYQIIGLINIADADVRINQQPSVTIIEDFSYDQPHTLLLDAVKPMLGNLDVVMVKTGYSIQTGQPPKHAYTIDRSRQLVEIHSELVRSIRGLAATMPTTQ